MSTLRSPNNSGSFALQSSQQNLTVDFGYRGDSSLSGTVFNDPNDNKVLDPGESPRGGVTVHLLGADGKIIVTTTTNADGYYKFENLLAGTFQSPRRSISQLDYLPGQMERNRSKLR